MVCILQPVRPEQASDVVQEVVLEEKRNAQHKLHVDGVLAEDVVEAGAFHAELAGQPCHGTALPLQLILDAAAYLQVVDCQLQPFVPVELHDAWLRHQAAHIRIGLRNGEAFGNAGAKSLLVPHFILSFIFRLYIHFQCVFDSMQYDSGTFFGVQNSPLP